MNLRLDPWASEYNTAYHAEAVLTEQRDNVDTSLECDTWAPITPKAPDTLPFDTLLFMDGTRRLEARVLLEDELKQIAFGAIGSYGVGVIDCCPEGRRRAAHLDLSECLGVTAIRRICALSGGYELAAFDVAPNLKTQLGMLNYQVITTHERDADAVVRRLQFEMLKAESQLASRLVDTFPDALIISDGPRPRMGGVENVVGYVKTIHQVKINEAQLETVRHLEAGQRSPLYLVSGDDKSQQLFEWFLRLRDPNPWLYSLAGIVRLQAHAGSHPKQRLKETQTLADWLALTLPKFASRQHQDPRAPQQLLPVRALESELKRRMGDAGVVRRRITQYLAGL